MQKNKAIVIFLAKFFATYFILFGVYSFYLSKNQQKGDVFSCAPITRTVATHVHKVATMLGYDTVIRQNENELSMDLIIDGKYTSRNHRGMQLRQCDHIVSVIHYCLFGKFQEYSPFRVVWVVLIYVVNVLRIIALTILYHKFPEYQGILHDLLFPAIIYGLTFMLWVTWVKFFSNYERNETR